MINLILFICRWKGESVGAAIATIQTPTSQIHDQLAKSASVQQYIILLWRFNTFLKQSNLQLCAPSTSS